MKNEYNMDTSSTGSYSNVGNYSEDQNAQYYNTKKALATDTEYDIIKDIINGNL